MIDHKCVGCGKFTKHGVACSCGQPAPKPKKEVELDPELEAKPQLRRTLAEEIFRPKGEEDEFTGEQLWQR